MNKKYTFLIIILMLIVANPVFAQQKVEENDSEVIKPGVLPNSFWYWSDIFAEEIKYVFTIGKQRRADYLLKLSEERMAELKEINNQGIKGHAEGLIEKQEHHLKKYQELLINIKEKSVSDAESATYEIKQRGANFQEGVEGIPAEVMGAKKTIWDKVKSWFGK